MKRIGLYFGSFNPIHTGHLIIAEFMREAAQFDQVWFVVSPANPFKEDAQLWPAEERLQLTEMAVNGNDYLSVCAIEFLMPRPSYTADTLHRLRAENPATHFSIIMGSDSLHSLPRWKDSQYILDNFDIHVYRRKTTQEPLVTGQKIHIHEAPYLDISATLIRERIQAGLSIRYLVPDAVWEIIRK
jgi:nicotinate-nucleotide adenylyltransferase